MGVSLAAFQANIGVVSSFTTGGVSASFIHRPYFTNYHEDYTKHRDNNEQPILKVSQGEDAINISISNALPQDQYELVYTVQNTGSFPIKIDCQVNENDKDLIIKSYPPSGAIGPGSASQGSVLIEIEEDEEVLEAICLAFILELNYILWNLDN